MASENSPTLGQLLNDLDVTTEKIYRRLKDEFQPKDENDSNYLFQTHVKQRYITSSLMKHESC